MNVTIANEGGKVISAVNGRVDTTNAADFQEQVKPLMELQNPDIEMDCSGLEYTSSQGLRVFLMLQKAVSANGGKLVLLNMQPQVKEVFDITGFSNIISIL